MRPTGSARPPIPVHTANNSAANQAAMLDNRLVELIRTADDVTFNF